MAMSTRVAKLRRLSPWLKALCLLCAVAALSHTIRQLELRPAGYDGSDGGNASWFDAYRRLKKQRPHMLAKERQEEHQQEEQEESTSPTPSPTVDLQGRIVGGHEAQRGRYKGLAALYSGDNHMCGGTVIGSNVLITAAHCLPVINKARTNIFDKRTKGGEIESFDIVRKIECPKYGKGPLGNECDMAVLEISGHTTMPPVRLNDDAALPRNDQGVTVVGWGALAEGGFTSSKQQEVEVYAMPNTECATFYPGRITDDMMCAAVEGGGKDACQGDSGGPCFIKGASAAEDVLIGVVSWGRGCARADSPGVYGRVSFELDWIKRSCCSINAQAECCVGSARPPLTPGGPPSGGPRPPVPGGDSGGGGVYVPPQRPPQPPAGVTSFNPPRPQPQVQKVTQRPTLRPTPPPTKMPTQPSPQVQPQMDSFWQQQQEQYHQQLQQQNQQQNPQDNSLSQWFQQGSQQQPEPQPEPEPEPEPQPQPTQPEPVNIHPGLNYDEQTLKELGYDPATGLFHVHNKQP